MYLARFLKRDLQMAQSTQSTHPNVLEFIYRGLRQTSSTWTLGLMTSLLVLNAILDYVSEMYVVRMAAYVSANHITLIVWLIWGRMAIDALYDIIKYCIAYSKNKISTTLMKFYYTDFTNQYFDVGLAVAQHRKSKEDMAKIKQAVSSNVGLINQSDHIIRCVLAVATAVIVTVSVVGPIGLPICFFMTIILIIGARFMKQNYQGQKKIEKETNPLAILVTNMTESIWWARINGYDEKLRQKIIFNSVKKNELEIELSNKIELRYSVLAIVSGIVIAICIKTIANDLYETNTLYLLIPVCNNIKRMCQVMWWSFHTIGRTATTVAGATVLEDIPLESKQRKRQLVPLTDPLAALSAAFELDLPESCREVILKAPSAGGKTTLMKNVMIDLVETYGYVLYYMEQNMRSEKSSELTLWQFLTFGLDDADANRSEVEHLIMTLASESKLNLSQSLMQLDKPIGQPSGGEDNRLCFMRSILPIMWDMQCSRGLRPFIFIDEATAGLDHQTYGQVRQILNEIRDTYGVTIVIIDHHLDSLSVVLNSAVEKIRQTIPFASGRSVHLLKKLSLDINRTTEQLGLKTSPFSGSAQGALATMGSVDPKIIELRVLKSDCPTDKMIAPTPKKSDNVTKILEWFVDLVLGKSEEETQKSKSTSESKPPKVWAEFA